MTSSRKANCRYSALNIQPALFKHGRWTSQAPGSTQSVVYEVFTYAAKAPRQCCWSVQTVIMRETSQLASLFACLQPHSCQSLYLCTDQVRDIQDISKSYVRNDRGDSERQFEEKSPIKAGPEMILYNTTNDEEYNGRSFLKREWLIAEGSTCCSCHKCSKCPSWAYTHTLVWRRKETRIRSNAGTSITNSWGVRALLPTISSTCSDLATFLRPTNARDHAHAGHCNITQQVYLP
jgi:hypothetical protein